MQQSENEDHAKLSPSSSDIWLNCSGSLINQPEDEGSTFALEGTAAHAMAEHCLTKQIDATAAPAHPDWERFDSPEMRDHVQTYLDYVRRHVGDGELFIEQRLQIHPMFGVWGTADAVVVGKDGVIHLADLKYGQGVLVEPESTQLLLYAIGAAASFTWLSDVPVHTVTVHIVQPRRNNLVSKSYSVEELADWVRTNESRIARAANGVEAYEAGAHCKWCRKRAVCKTRAEYNLATAMLDFDTIDCAPADPTQIDEAKLVQIFKRLPVLEKWIKDVEAEVARRSHDHVPAGLKWVAGKNMRFITDPTAAAGVLEVAGINPYAERKMLGFGDLEKLTKAAGQKLNDLIGQFIDKRQSKPVLVGDDDPRPAYQPAEADFADELNKA